MQVRLACGKLITLSKLKCEANTSPCNLHSDLKTKVTFAAACTEVCTLFNLRSTIAAKHGDNEENGAEIVNSIHQVLFAMPLKTADQFVLSVLP